MAISTIEAYQASDGKIFESECKAEAYEDNFIKSAIDKIFAVWGAADPLANYPNSKRTLIPFVQAHAKELIKILELV